MEKNNFLIPKILIGVLTIFMLLITAIAFNWFGFNESLGGNPPSGDVDDNVNGQDDEDDLGDEGQELVGNFTLICNNNEVEEGVQASFNYTFNFIDNGLKSSYHQVEMMLIDEEFHENYEYSKLILEALAEGDADPIPGMDVDYNDLGERAIFSLAVDYNLVEDEVQIDDTVIVTSYSEFNLDDPIERVRDYNQAEGYFCN